MAGVSNQTVEHDAKTRGIILHIVEQIKSQGVFDRFRRDCLEELDSKEPYRQLKQRVESHVATFLSKQTFSANLPKNQLRTSLRANINQSEVLSKGVDRLLEQVLVEKSIPFYKEIENLVEEHLISTGHYTRYERDKPQKSEREGQPRSEHTKLSDKEVEDIIKEETNKLLEATADGGKSQESDKNSLVDSPPPGTSGEVIEVESLISSNDGTSAKNCQTSKNVGSIEKSETAELSSVNAEENSKVETAMCGEPEVKVKTEDGEQAQKSEIAVAQVVIESQQRLVDEATSKEMDAQLPEPVDSTSAYSSNEDYQFSKPEIMAESNPLKSSAMLDVGLNDEAEAMDVELEPPTLEQNTLEDGNLNENISVIQEMERSGYPPAVENTQAAAAKLVEEDNIEQQDVSKESHTEVDLHVLNPGIKLGESKAEVEELNIPTETDVNSETEIKKDDTHKAKVDKLEIFTPEEKTSGIHKPLEPEVLQPKALQAEVVMPEVNKPKVDKTQKPEETAKQTAAEEKYKLSSKDSVKQATKETLAVSNIFSTDEETDEDLGIVDERIITRSKPEENKPNLSALEIAEFSDSDITVSSVHTSDLSSLEDSMSDMEYEDYQELALKKNKQKKTGEFSAGISKDIYSKESKFDRSSTHISQKIDGENESEEEESGESGAGTSQKLGSKGESEEKYGESGTIGENEVDGEEHNQEKCEESGAATNEDIDSKEKRNIESVGSCAASSVLPPEPSISRSLATTPKRWETSDNLLSVSRDDDNQTSQDFPQETTPSSTQSSEPVKNIENLVPDVEPISSYDSEPAKTTDAISDGDEIVLDDTEVGNPKLGQQKHRHQISTGQESESSNDIQTPGEEQRESYPQRRSARVASKDKLKSDEKDDSFQGYNKAQEKDQEGGDSTRRLRRRHSSQEKGNDLRGSRSKEERRKERAEKRAARLTSDSNDSDVKIAKRSKRQVRPTRCYSPSENS